MTRPIDLDGFETKFASSDDPWSTWSDPDEALKRRAILHALGPGASGRVLELGAGNGSNSQSIARRVLRLDATEATHQGTALVARAISARSPRARAVRLVVPAEPPRLAYDAVVIAELLYYLRPSDMRALARQIARRLRPGGTLVLAHHRVTFYDFAQHAAGIQERFLTATNAHWHLRIVRRTRSWEVWSCSRR